MDLEKFNRIYKIASKFPGGTKFVNLFEIIYFDWYEWLFRLTLLGTVIYILREILIPKSSFLFWLSLIFLLPLPIIINLVLLLATLVLIGKIASVIIKFILGLKEDEIV